MRGGRSRLRRACRYLGIHRSLLQYRSRAAPQMALRQRLGELALAKPRWGSPRFTWRLQREGWEVNHKRIERLVREERLLVASAPGGSEWPCRGCRRRCRPARTSAGAWTSCATRRPRAARSECGRWWMTPPASVRCSSSIGRCRRGAWSRRWPCSAALRRRPLAIVCDNGPEFVSQALDHWASRQASTSTYSPRPPRENCFIESFNGKLRDECLSQYHFATLAEARHRIEQWRQGTTPSGRTAAWGTAPQRSTPHDSPPRRGTPQP
ncbi:MAG: transposase [Gemmatimonadetes bacterium]|nr:transposase [Gemmatimonadota bacterium]